MDMQGYLACGFIASTGSITKCASLYSIFISIALIRYITILCKHLCYFQAGGKQSDFLFPSSIFSSYYGAKHKTSHTGLPGDSRINAPSWVPQKHTPRLYPRHKKDQPITLLSWVPRSPSKLGLQAPAPES